MPSEIENIVNNITGLPRLERRAEYAKLPPHIQVVVRPYLEAKRGIKRDLTGKIVRDTVWLSNRIMLLQQKRTDMEARIKSIDAELAARQAEYKLASGA